MSEPSSPSDVYARLLLPKHHGYPLFIAEPDDNLPLEYRTKGTSIGDVGIITADGSFDFVFNICVSANDRVNCYGVPDGFEQVTLDPEDISLLSNMHPLGSDVSSASVKKTNITVEGSQKENELLHMPVGVSAGYSFTSTSSEAAILALPEGAARQNLRNLTKFRRHAIQNTLRWYQFVNSTLGREAPNGSLYLVTGCDKSTTWGIASVSGASGSSSLFLKATAAQIAEARVSYSYSWETRCPATVRVGPESCGNSARLQNQCVFVRGFKMAVREGPMAALMGAAKLSSIVGSKPGDILSGSNGNRPPFMDAGKRFWSSKGSSSGESAGSHQRSHSPPSPSDNIDEVEVDVPHDVGEDVTLEFIPGTIEVYHPLNAVNKHLLASMLDAQVVVTHESDWWTLCNDDESLPTDEELIGRLQSRYRTTMELGGVFLIPKDSEQPHNDAPGSEAQSPMHQSPALFDGVNNPPNGAYTRLLLPKRHRYPLFGVKTDDNHRFKHRPKVPNIIQGRQTQPNVFSNIVRSQKDRKYELIQAKIGLQSLFNVAAMDPAPGLSLCLSIVITIIESIDVTNTNQEECLQLAERVTEIFYAIINQTAQRKGGITIGLNHALIALSETLEMVRSFIFHQGRRSYISRMWTLGGDTHVIKQLNVQLDNAMSLFELKSHIAIQRKLEVLRLLLEGRSTGAEDCTSQESNTPHADGAIGSSCIPPAPSIFYGREETVDKMVKIITTREPARVAILGTGGIGKTSLSLVVLHHPKIVESFGSNRWFIQCEGSSSPQGLVSVIAKCLGLSGNKLFERIILFFETQKTVLLLDNFETPWETIETREEIERMLSRLAAIKTLTLLVTMRGCERPFGTAWTRPVIAPLTPLDLVASRLTFIDISDTSKDDPNLEELLKALDNLPLAITLMARQAQSQPPGVLLERWYSQNTAMLTVGPRHRLSSLEISIKISLDGPRMRNNPYATRLLRILALLPQGSKDLKEIAPGIPNVHSAAAVLEQVGLAHVDGIGSLRVLAPVRRFIVQNYPPDADSWQPVQRHFEALATMSSKIERGMEGQAIVDRLSSQTSNMQAVFERSLDTDGADYRRVIRAAINLTDLFKYTGLGSLTTVIKSSAKAEAIGDKALLADCIRSEAEIHYSRSSQELATAGFEKALRLYRGLDGEYFSEQGRCTMMLGMVESQAGNYADAIANIECAIELHRRAKDVIGEADCLSRLAQNAICQQKYSVAMPCINAAVVIYQKHANLRGQAHCKWLLGVILQERRVEYPDAFETVADAALAYQFLGDITGEANCLRILGRIELQTAKYRDAIQRLHKAMTLYRKVNCLYGEADCYQAQGEVYMGRRDELSAEVYFIKAKALFSEINHRGGHVFCTRVLGDIAFRRRNYAEARQIYEEAAEMSQTHIDQCRAEFGIASVALALGDELRAQCLYDKVLPVFQQHGHAVPDEAHTLKKLGDVAVKAGNDEQAKDFFEHALVKFRVTGIVPAQADCLVRLAEVATRQSARREALSRYDEAMSLYCEAEDDERRSLCSKALQELEHAVPPPMHQWVKLL